MRVALMDFWPDDDPPLVILAPYGTMAWWRAWSAEVLRRRA